MKISKTTVLKAELQLAVTKAEKIESIFEWVHPRIRSKTSDVFGSKKASNSLLLQMYCQENEVLFI